MKKLLALLLWLLCSAPLWAGNDCVGSITGYYSSTGSWTSCGGGVPGDGDTIASIANGVTITIDQNIGTVGGGGIGLITVGASDSSTAVLKYAAVGGPYTITFASGAGFNVRHGAKLDLESSGSNILTMQTLATDGSAYWKIYDQTYTYVSKIILKNNVLNNIGSTSVDGLSWGQPMTGSVWTIEGNTFNNSYRAHGNLLDNVTYAGLSTFKNNKWLGGGGGSGNGLLYLGYDKGTEISGNFFGSPNAPVNATNGYIVHLNNSNITYTGTLIHDNYMWIDARNYNATGIYTSFAQGVQIYNNLLYDFYVDITTQNNGEGIHIGGATTVYSWSVHDNYVSGFSHNIVCLVTGDTAGSSIYNNFTTNGGNEELYHSDGNNTIWHNNIATRGVRLQNVNAFLEYNGSGVQVYHNTMDSNHNTMSGYTDQASQFGNYGISKAATNTIVRDNLMLHSKQFGILNKNIPVNTWTTLDYNDYFDNLYNYYQEDNSAVQSDATATLAGPHDKYVDPTFINIAAKNISQHAVYLGNGGASDADWYNNAMANVSGFSTTALLTWLRTQWAPTNPLLKNSASDGASDMGAVNGVYPGSSFLLLGVENLQKPLGK